MPRDELTRPLGLTPQRSAFPKIWLLLGAVTVVVVAAGGIGGFWLTLGAGLFSANGPLATAPITATTATQGRTVDTAVRTAALPAQQPTTAPAPSAQGVIVRPAGPGLVELTPSGSLAEVDAV